MSLKRKLALSVAGVVALAGTGVAVAASSGGGHARTAVLPFNGVSNRLGVHAGAFGWGVRGPGMGFGHRGGELSAAASYLGISSSELLSDLRSGKTLAQVADATSGKSASGLIQALVAAEKQRLDAAVAAGKLTQAQEDTIVSGLQQRVTDLVNGTRPAGGPGMGLGHRGGELSAAASYLGISSSELLSDLRSGKTLAQVADATSGKSASGLIQALVAAEKQRLDAAVAAGKLTQAQEDTIVSGLQQRVTDLVNGTLRMHRGGPHGGWMGSSSGGATA